MSVAGAAAQSAGKPFVDVEAGAACSNNRDVSSAVPDLGDNGCGWTGAVAIGQFGKAIIGPFDYWSVRGRYTKFDDDSAAFSFADRRMVVDAEIGAKLGFGFFGGTSRVVGGIRFANYRGDFGGMLGSGLITSDAKFVGIGPRIGMVSSIPLGSSFRYDSQNGVAALFGRHEIAQSISGVETGTASGTGVVYSLESSSALTYLMGKAGAEVSLGVRSEYWFGQSKLEESATTNSINRNRHSWGPFARVRVPLQ
jgi:hypothetical protein